MKFKISHLQLIFNIIFLAFLFSLGLVLFKDQFKYGLTSDDYRLLLTIKGNIVFLNTHTLSTFMQPVGGQALFLFIVNMFFGYEPQWYFISALVLRVIAAFSIYLLGKSLFRNKYIGLAASLLFMASYVGIQSEGPINSNTYLAIAFMNFGLINLFAYFKEKDKKVLDKTFLIGCGWLLLALAFNSIRMHGIVFLFVIIETASALLRKNKISFFFFQIILFLMTVFVEKNLGLFEGSFGSAPQFARALLDPNYLSKIPTPLKTVLYPLTSFYQMIFIPEFNPLSRIFALIFANLNLSNPKTFLLLLVPHLILTGVSIYREKGSRLALFLLSLSWFAFLLALGKIFPLSLLGEGTFMLLGGFITFAVFFVIILLAKTKRLDALILITLLAWPFSFTLIPHLVYPSAPHVTFSRYLTVPVAGICLLVSYLAITGLGFVTAQFIHFAPKYHRLLEFSKVSVLAIFFTIVFVNNFNLVKALYKSEGEAGNYRQYIDNAFEIMNKEIGDRSGKVRPVVYLVSDNSDFTYRAITEGGEERFSLLNNNLSENARPFFVTSYEDLVGIFCNKKYPLKTKINDIFAFKIVNKQVFVETKGIRESLLKDTQNYKKCPNKLTN